MRATSDSERRTRRATVWGITACLALMAAGCGSSGGEAGSSSEGTTTVTALDTTGTGECTLDYADIDWSAPAQEIVDAHDAADQACDELLSTNTEAVFALDTFRRVIGGNFSNFDDRDPENVEEELEVLRSWNSDRIATIDLAVRGTDPCEGAEPDDLVSAALATRDDAEPTFDTGTLARGVQQFKVETQADFTDYEEAEPLPGGGGLLATYYGREVTDCTIAWAVRGGDAAMVIAPDVDTARREVAALLP